MFVVLGGQVSLDFGVDSPNAQLYGPGALVGLPATLTRSSYSMTATVAEDATLGYLPREVLEPLLRNNPSVTQELLVILGEKTLEMKRMKQGLLESERLPVQA
jgi:CRP-like cAMP-binding protein